MGRRWHKPKHDQAFPITKPFIIITPSILKFNTTTTPFIFSNEFQILHHLTSRRGPDTRSPGLQCQWGPEIPAKTSLSPGSLQIKTSQEGRVSLREFSPPSFHQTGSVRFIQNIICWWPEQVEHQPHAVVASLASSDSKLHLIILIRPSTCSMLFNLKKFPKAFRVEPPRSLTCRLCNHPNISSQTAGWHMLLCLFTFGKADIPPSSPPGPLLRGRVWMDG